ncbi:MULTISPECIES: hypothetical protein [Aliivibrio]|uniref:Type IV pilus, mannose-sensitive hemagglutinin D (MSHK) n=1 Tax=Aliivibrio fischeri (strain MJ11) TaxID=388396 RepID=B5FGN5_ALIFM|nr:MULTISPECIES: hypothetical protein [Aliivibrio]ACH67207.1 conserved hypothetical protein [Aliivibrio fischeri MJ11]MBD1569281.1 type IV pilus, mannose-sensitive hemagglutinin D (MSHK) [Aliivibrio sp. S10_S31]MCE4937190.1 type IV pilus, mannose-sensitive hemagglutinin D (MSHK) [Aliivibrio fischeri]MUH96987.1 type IV pilus, mannose-sensitive hemagglutinin D (MSHK) [Aliivibrio fischeri]MUI64663.1 type IV pilus, mannose-sensitive hemagglutinin D (MSHK) [Aliivibrio fischeri]
MKNRFLVFILMSLPLSVSASEAVLGHDPTEPLSWSTPAPVQKKVIKKRQYFPSLQAINCNAESDCYAVLDDKSMKRGDKVSGYTLLTIGEESVSIGRAGKQWQLSLFPQNIKN